LVHQTVIQLFQYWMPPARACPYTVFQMNFIQSHLLDVLPTLSVPGVGLISNVSMWQSERTACRPRMRLDVFLQSFAKRCDGSIKTIRPL
jgi:hypothetical protein